MRSGPDLGGTTPPGQASDDGRTATAVFRVRFDEATPAGLARSSALLRYAADLAWVHSEQRGFGRTWYAERGLAWVVRGVELAVLARIGHGELLAGTTQAVGARKVIARRRSDFVGPDGAPVASLNVDWALTTVDGAPTRIPALFATVFTMPDLAFNPIRVRPAAPVGGLDAPVATLELAVRPQELDPMGHVNNAIYLDWAEEAIRAVGPAGAAAVEALPRRWRLEYLGAAASGQSVRVRAWPDEAGWACRIDEPTSDSLLVGAHLAG